MPVPKQLRLTVDLELDRDPIRGSVKVEDGAAAPFTGWIQLLSTLDTARLGSQTAPWSSERPPSQ